MLKAFMRPWRLQYASGLYGDKGWREAAAALTPGAGRYLALLGNCGSLATPAQAKQTQEFLRSCSASWEKVFWVLGPHEYNGGEKEEVYTAVEDRLRQLTGTTKNVVILCQNEYQTCEDVVLMGATGWSDSAGWMSKGLLPRGVMEEKIFSFNEGKKKAVTMKTLREWHEQDMEWLTQRAEAWGSYNPGLKKVVLTHHLCSGWLLNNALDKRVFDRAPLDVISCDSADDILHAKDAARVDAWLCGAGGSCTSGMFGGTFASVNALYGGPWKGSAPNPNFLPDRILEFGKAWQWPRGGGGGAEAVVGLSPALQ